MAIHAYITYHAILRFEIVCIVVIDLDKGAVALAVGYTRQLTAPGPGRGSS